MFPIFGDKFVLNPPTYFMLLGRPVYFYAVIISFGFILACIYILRRRNEFGLTQDNVLDLFIIAVPSGIVGARLYYVLFNSSLYFGPGKWANIIKVWEGGLGFYGGAIAAALGVYVYCRIKKIPLGVFFDVGALGLLIGQSIGRWGNFINREAYGSETELPWKMGLTTQDGTIFVHPTFLYESLWNALGFLLIHNFSKKHKKYDGQIFLLYLAWYGFGRFIIEGLRSDSLYIGQTDIRVSQLVAALTFGISVYFLLRNHLIKKHTPDQLYVNSLRDKALSPEKYGAVSENEEHSSENTPDKTDETTEDESAGNESDDD